jgi:hypothetical protein
MRIARSWLVFLTVFIGGWSGVYYVASIIFKAPHGMHRVDPLPAIVSALAIGLCSIALALQGSSTSRKVLVLLLWGCVLLALVGSLVLLLAVVASMRTDFEVVAVWETVTPIALAAGLGSIAACIANKEDPPAAP